MEIKGIKYISPAFDHCYDDKTEVLTDQGWVFLKDVTYDYKVATLNTEHVLEYHYPDNIIKEDWDGLMYKFYSYKSCIDLVVTPNHNMYVQTERMHKKGKNIGWKFEKPLDIFGYCRYFKKDAEYIVKPLEYVKICGRKIKTEDWLEFLGYYLSEGYSTIAERLVKGRKRKTCNYIVGIRQFKHLDIMAKALDKVTPNKINIRRKEGRVIVNDKALCIYLKNKFGNKYYKYIPRYILNNASKKQLRILFESLMLGDGSDKRNKKGGYSFGGSLYSTSSVKLKDDFMELLLKIGFSGSCIKVYSKGSVVKVFNRKCIAGADHWHIRIRFKNNCCSKKPYANSKTMEKFIPYKGKIYCVEVQNHTLYVRRNGFPVWCGNSGYGQASRGYILSLHKRGIPITLAPVSFEEELTPLGKEGDLLNSLIDKQIDYNIVITHLTPEFWKDKIEAGKINLGYTVWETTKLHHSWPGFINNSVDVVMVGCEWNIDVFKNSGVTIPIHSVPHGIDFDEFEDVEPYTLSGIKKDAFKFYDIFQFTERKHPMALIKSYWAAFRNNENVALILKTYKDNFSDKEKNTIKEIIQKLKDVTRMDNYPPVYLILDMLSREEILGLHKAGDCFVSLNRFEGFGLGGFEAGAIGNPVIITGGGGVLEYAKPDNSYLVKYFLTPVSGMNWSPWYSGRGDQMWAEPDCGHAIELMRHVYNNQDEAKEKGRLLKKYIFENLKWDIVAKKMISVIEGI